MNAKLRLLAVTKLEGPDQLKDWAHKMAIPLAKIIAEPVNWKIANVVPLFKKKEAKSHPCNYKPVSWTATAGKILELILRERIVKDMEGN